MKPCRLLMILVMPSSPAGRAWHGPLWKMFFLSQMFYMGKGFLQNHAAAGKWYTLAAKQGHDIAQKHLGLAYALGSGVLKDYVYAHMW